MANANTIASLTNLTGPNSATETCVQAPVGYINRLGASTTGTPLRALLEIRPDVTGGQFDGRPFKLRVIAQSIATGTNNFTVNVYWNSNNNTNLTTLTSDVLVIGSGAIAQASKTSYSFMEATCFWDSSLQQLAAFWNETAGLNDLITTPAIVKTTAAVTATNPLASSLANAQASLGFFVTFTCGTPGNVTSTKLIELAVDQI